MENPQWVDEEMEVKKVRRERERKSEGIQNKNNTRKNNKKNNNNNNCAAANWSRPLLINATLARIPELFLCYSCFCLVTFDFLSSDLLYLHS